MPRPLIVVECASNHGGSRDHMQTMIQQASDAGADFVKWQSYQTRHLSPHDAQLGWLEQAELSDADHVFLVDMCASYRIGLMTTVFHEDRVEFLVGVGITHIKIGSGEAMRQPLLEAVGAHAWESVSVSTGLIDTDENLARVAAMDRVILNHCVSRYPTPDMHAALSRMSWLARLGVPVGYSDHTVGITAACAACVLGAYAVEVHMLGPGRQRAAWDKSPSDVAALVAFARRQHTQCEWSHEDPDDAKDRFIGRWDYPRQAVRTPVPAVEVARGGMGTVPRGLDAC